MLIVPSLKNTLQSKLYQKLSQSLFNVEAKNKTKPEMVKDQIWLSTKGWQKNVNETEGDTWVGLKRTINKTDSGSYNLLNAQVVTAHLMGCRRVAEHVAESHPFVWPANFSLLAKSLESARQKESIVAWWSKPSKTKKKNNPQCDPVQVASSARDARLAAKSVPREQRSTSWAREIYQGWAGNLSDLQL